MAALPLTKMQTRHKLGKALVMAAVSLSLAATWHDRAEGQVLFADISDEAGVSGHLYASPSDHSLGVNWIDFDNDYLPDLYLVNGGGDNRQHLYRNQGDGTFAPVDHLLPSLSALPQQATVEQSGSVFADYDNDGDSDIYVFADGMDFNGLNGPNHPYGPPNFLYKNLWSENGGRIIPGQPLFEEVASAAGIDDRGPRIQGSFTNFRAKSGGWLDYDRDGCIDLYVGHLVFGVTGGDFPNRDQLFRNRCDGTFQDVTSESGVAGSDPERYRLSLAFLGGHLNQDLWPDMYVVNIDTIRPDTNGDLIYLNNGDGTFTEMTTANPEIGDDAFAGMGIDAADIDLDGDWDLYISDLLARSIFDTTPDGNVLYLGSADGSFQDNSAPDAGIRAHNSWGVTFFDVDHDGYEDLFVATMGNPVEPFLFLNNQDGTFRDVTEASGLSAPRGRGTAYADFDQDGDLDIGVVNEEGGFSLFRNETEAQGNWLRVRLKATRSNRSAIGAVIRVQAGELAMMRQFTAGSSAHSQNELVAHFGLAAATSAREVQVLWPSGEEDLVRDAAANQVLTVTEGTTARPRPVIHSIPAVVEFPATPQTESAVASLRVINEGSQPLQAGDLATTEAAFEIVNPAGAFEVPPYGGSREVTLRFRPDREAELSSTLTILSNDPDRPNLKVPLLGRGLEAERPSRPQVLRSRSGGGGAAGRD